MVKILDDMDKFSLVFRLMFMKYSTKLLKNRELAQTVNNIVEYLKK